MMPLHSCHCCGLIQWSLATPGEVCGRCETGLGSRWASEARNRLALALCLTAMVLYIPAVTWRFLRIEQLGQTHESSLLHGVRALFAEGHLLVGVIVLLFSIILPIVKLTGLLFLCQPQWRMQPKHLAFTYRAVEHLGRWGMLDVLLVAVMVAFVKLGGLVHFGAGPGLVMFAMFVVTSLCASLAFDPHGLWAESTQGGEPPTPPAGADQSESTLPETAFPPARQKKLWVQWPTWGVWLIPVLTLLIVGGIALRGWLNQPRRIEVTFEEGHGIKAGDQLRYHGVVVGEVDAVRFAESLEELVVRVELTPDGDRLAREGTRFWIVRPHFDLTGIGGLDTVVGAKYLAIQPGAARGPAVARFRGIEEPPLPDLDFPGGIEIILESPDAEGLSPGTAVYYRRLRIGGVIASGLTLDQSRVEARVYIRPEYRNLIRSGTVFWNMSGVRVQGGLTEFSVHVSPVESLIQGGIGLAVPPESGEPVSDGYRFPLGEQIESEWLKWQPILGTSPVPVPSNLPTLLPAKLAWTHDGLVRNSARTRTGWVLRIGERTLGPEDLLSVPPGAIAGSASLTIGEEKFEETQLQAAHADEGRSLMAAEFPTNSAIHLRPLRVAENCFLVTGGDQPPVYIAAGLMRAEGKFWSLDPDLPLTSQHHGGVLVAHPDGALLGLVSVDGREYRVQVIEPSDD
jgi:paraquat-inducible protein B